MNFDPEDDYCDVCGHHLPIVGRCDQHDDEDEEDQ